MVLGLDYIWDLEAEELVAVVVGLYLPLYGVGFGLYLGS